MNSHIANHIFSRAETCYRQECANYMMNAAYNRRAIDAGGMQTPNFDLWLVVMDRDANGGKPTGYLYAQLIKERGRPDCPLAIQGADLFWIRRKSPPPFESPAEPP